MGRRETLTAGRVKVPLLVFRWTTRTTPSFPGDTAVIRPIFQESGGELSSWMMTSSPTWRFVCGLVHLERSWSVCKYSLCHLFQKCWETAWINLQRCRGVDESNRFGSMRDVNGPPVKKCPGVIGCKSFGSAESGVIGLEFKTASTLAVKVINSS